MTKLTQEEADAFSSGYRNGTDAAVWFVEQPSKIRVPFLHKDNSTYWTKGFDKGFADRRKALDETIEPE